jgi:hypothetical protein
MEPVDKSWRALWIDADGDLRISSPEKGCDLDFERPGTVFACGEGSALALTERYLHSTSFLLAHALEVSSAEAARTPNDPFTDLT